jgi:hypothetical protein
MGMEYVLPLQNFDATGKPIAGSRTVWTLNLQTKKLSRNNFLPAKAAFDMSNGNLVLAEEIGTTTKTMLIHNVTPYTFAPSFVWQSKAFEFNRHGSFSWVQCVAAAYPVTVKFLLWKTRSVSTTPETVVVSFTDHNPRRFNAGSYHRVGLRIESAHPVSKVVLTSDRSELEYVG